ncbi:MAG: hypothetical protein NZ482_01855 [Gloeomargarita sp. SKYG98]|nr:hypothetical protein [Gloeomargarita sp. SKYG98]
MRPVFLGGVHVVDSDRPTRVAVSGPVHPAAQVAAHLQAVRIAVAME